MNNRILSKITVGWMIILLSLTLSPVTCFSQNKPDEKQKPQEKNQVLTADQSAKLKKILSQYNSSKLTAADAKAIHEKFREAGIHGGPETNDAIKAAGFDPEKLKTLAPPPNKDEKGITGPQTTENRLKNVEEKIIKPLVLNASQKETVNKAFKDFYTEMEKLTKGQANAQARPDKAKVEPLEKTRDEKIKKVLTADQYKKYLELEKSSRPAKPKEGK